MSDDQIRMNDYNRSQALTSLMRRIPEAHAKSVRSTALVAGRQAKKVRDLNAAVERRKGELRRQLAEMDAIKAELEAYEDGSHPQLAAIFDEKIDAMGEIEGRWLTTQMPVQAMITKARKLGMDEDDLQRTLDLLLPEWDLDDADGMASYQRYMG